MWPRILSGEGTVLEAGKWSTRSVMKNGSVVNSWIFFPYSWWFVPLLCAIATEALRPAKSRVARDAHNVLGSKPRSAAANTDKLPRKILIIASLLFIVATNRSLHHVTPRPKQTFQPFCRMRVPLQSRDSIMLPCPGGKND